MNTLNFVERLALRLAREHGHRADSYELSVKALDLAEWHDVAPDEQRWFARVFCAECHKIWDGDL
jgi:hypothetical protein